jgi:hypothetical protein
MRSITYFFALFAISGSLISCTVKTHHRYPVYEDYADPTGKHLFARTWATCQNLSNCSPSVGMVASRKEGHWIGRCTGFLTDDGYFVTNDHCVPTNLSVGSSCYSTIEIFFPDTGQYPQESARCDNVVWRSGDQQDTNPQTVDTAYLKLSTTVQRPALKFDHDGLSTLTPFTVYSVNPDPMGDYLTGTVVARNCDAQEDNEVFHTINGTSGKVLMLAAPCQIISGNSGSPVVGANGHAYGIVHHSRNLSSEDIQLMGGYPDQDGRKNIVYQAHATSFSCLRGPTESSYVLPPECSQQLPPP